MSAGAAAGVQLRAIGWLHEVFAEQGIDYWLFGGWAVDFHAGRVTRDHADVDVAVWTADLDRISALLQAQGWTHAPEPGEDGYTGFEREAPGLSSPFSRGTRQAPSAHRSRRATVTGRSDRLGTTRPNWRGC